MVTEIRHGGCASCGGGQDEVLVSGVARETTDGASGKISAGNNYAVCSRPDCRKLVRLRREEY